MITTALLIGFAGSLHCVGMCSPLMMAVTTNRPSVIINRLLYNAGRILTYSLLGLLTAGAGKLLQIHQYQNLISIGLGVLLLIIAFSKVKVSISFISKALATASAFLKDAFSNILKRKSHGSTVLLGGINGLLPCGLTFLALTYCLTLEGPWDGLQFMFLFGIGTLPAMLGAAAILQLLIQRLHFNMRKLTIGMLIVSGIWMIARVFIIHLPHAHSLKDGIIDIVICR